jgi:DNA end-binding protein Ku
MWKGTVSVGLVSVPVKLYSAVRQKDVRFNELHDADAQRLKHVRICPKEGEEVPFDEIVKGYEISPGRYVVIEPDELAAIAPPSTRTLDVEQFAKGEEVDPLAFEKSYRLGPDKGGEKTFALLARALADTGLVGIGTVVLRTKEYLAALRAADGGLVLSTMRFADEIVDADTVEGMPEEAEMEFRDRELAIARQLVESLANDFEHDKYEDTYRARVLELIEQKAAGKELELAPVETAEAPDDLLAALEASLAEAKGSRATAPKRGGRAGGNGKPPATRSAKAASGGSTAKSKSPKGAAGGKATSKRAPATSANGSDNDGDGAGGRPRAAKRARKES